MEPVSMRNVCLQKGYAYCVVEEHNLFPGEGKEGCKLLPVIFCFQPLLSKVDLYTVPLKQKQKQKKNSR